MIFFRVLGDKAVARRLRRLSPKLQRRVLSKAARDSMRPILAQAKSNAPKKSGALAKSLRLRAMKPSKTRVGVKVVTSAKWFAGDQFYGAFQEFGWKTGKRKGENKKPRRQIPGKHFIEEAYKSGKARAQSAFWRHVKRGLSTVSGGKK